MPKETSLRAYLSQKFNLDLNNTDDESKTRLRPNLNILVFYFNRALKNSHWSIFIGILDMICQACSNHMCHSRVEAILIDYDTRHVECNDKAFKNRLHLEHYNELFYNLTRNVKNVQQYTNSILMDANKSLANYKLFGLNEDFVQMFGNILPWLNLSQNNLFYLNRCMFTSDVANELTYLDLSKNAISYIQDSTFSRLSNLKTLLLNSNLIQSLDHSVFDKLVKLEKLDLSDNQLFQFDHMLFRYGKNKILFV